MKAVQASPEFIDWTRKHLADLLPMTRKIVATGEMHVPAMFVWPKKIELGVQIIPVAPFFESPTGKDVIGEIHREVAGDEQVDVACVITESWILDTAIPDDAELEKIRKQGIEDRPDKREAIVFNLINNQGMQLIASYVIKRPENTLADTPDIILDPTVGALEGKYKTGPGEISGVIGRMIVPPEKH